jgi:hypothetical protein
VTVAVSPVASTTWVEGNGGTDNNPLNEIRWSNKPAASGGSLATRTIASTTSQWYEWDLTSYLKAQKAAGKNVVTFLLTATAATTPLAVFNSRDATANRPVLQVTG